MAMKVNSISTVVRTQIKYLQLVQQVKLWTAEYNRHLVKTDKITTTDMISMRVCNHRITISFISMDEPMNSKKWRILDYPKLITWLSKACLIILYLKNTHTGIIIPTSKVPVYLWEWIQHQLNNYPRSLRSLLSVKSNLTAMMLLTAALHLLR